MAARSWSERGRTVRGLLAGPDLRRLGLLLAGGAAAQLWPRRWDFALVRLWFASYRLLAASTLDRLTSCLRDHVPAADCHDPRVEAEHHVRSRIEDMWMRLRGVRWRGARPTIEIEGLEHLRRALQRGRGAVLWCMRVGSATVLKQGLFESGHPLVHLSRFDHGSQTTTRVGITVVAPLFRRAEDAYLAERVRIPPGESLAYLRTLADRLAANQCVSIFGEHPGRQAIELPILGVRRSFALGAPSLAWRSGAALLTAYVLRCGAFRYRVVIEPEIAVDADAPRRRFAESAVQEFARRLELCVRRHPGDWQTWFYLDAASGRVRA